MKYEVGESKKLTQLMKYKIPIIKEIKPISIWQKLQRPVIPPDHWKTFDADTF